MKLKIGKKLKTTTHDSKFTGSYKKKSEYIVYILLCCRLQSRSRKISQGGGGAFLEV